MCNAKMAFLIQFVCIVFALISISFAYECNRRDYGHGSHVCVCNSHLQCDDLKVTVSKKTGVVTSFSTSKKGSRFLHHEYNFSAQAPSGTSTISVDVDRKQKYQKILGFGGTLTDAAVMNAAKLPKPLHDRFVRDYFADDGLEYNMARIPMGCTDASVRGYSYADGHDETLGKFALQHEDLDYKIPFIKMLKEVSHHPIKFFASPWAYCLPQWMKVDHKKEASGFIIGHPGGKYYKLFAKYFVRFLQEYAKHNVSMWGLTILNEPTYGNQPQYLFNATLERDFLKLDLGPELHSAGFGNVKVNIFDDNVGNLIEYVNTVLSDPGAAKYAAGIAYHFYSNTDQSRPKIEQIAKQHPDKYIFCSEACEFHWGKKDHVILGDWDMFNHYADDIIKVLNFLSSGFVDWSLNHDTQGGPNYIKNFVDAPIIVNLTSQEYYKQPLFYALGHFSKFLVPDSIRLHHNAHTSDHNILVTVFERPDKGTVLTVLNKNNHAVSLQVHDPAHGYARVDVAADSLESLIWY